MGPLSRRDAWEWVMPESVPVRCPACRREHVYLAPRYPCACGAPTAPRLDPAAAPTVSAHRAWDDDWITVSCTACGRENHWPHPELPCPCGTFLRIPVRTAGTETGSESTSGASEPRPTARPVRGAFQPRAIRTARDAVTVAALYLRRLGYRDIRRADQRPPSGIGLAAHGLLAQVDPTVRPATPRDVECLWLTAMTESAHCVYFSLAGYTDAARAAAGSLGVPLFVLDLAGIPQPANDPADRLDATGAPEPDGPGAAGGDGRAACPRPTAEEP